MNFTPLGSPKPEKKIYRLKRSPIKRKPYKIKPISKKRSKELRNYRKLKKKLDIKKCLKCGNEYEDYKDIDLHHIQSRGRCGADTEENLIGLCRNCHREITGEIRLKGE